MATLDQNLQQGMEGLPVGPNPANLEAQRFPSVLVQMREEAPPMVQQAPGANIIRAGTVVELPYHTNASGQPIQIQLEKDTSQEELQREIDAQFPRTAQAVALQMMAKGADPVSKDDYDFVKQQSKLMEKARGFRSEGEQSMLGALADAIPGAISGLLEGVGATAKAGLGVINSFDTNRNRIAAAGTILEGLIQGTERIGGIGSMLGSLITMDDYGAYKSLKDFERIEASRQAGDTAVLSLSPENAKQANKISQFLDATVLLPVAGKAVGFAGRVAGEQAIKQLAEQSSVGLIRKGIGKAMETTGALGTQLVDLSTNIAAEQLGKETILGSVAKGAGGVAKLKPQALEWAGKLIGSEAASETLAQGIRAAQAAGQSGTMLRAVAKVLPPDSVLRSAGAVADSVLNGAALGAGISGVQAASDPFNTKLDVAEQMTVGGITGGALGGVLGVIPGAAELTPAARNRRFVAEMAKDISDRPETRSFVLDGAEYATNDATNRVKLLSNDNMSATDKARIFAVTKSAEFSGHDVGYIDNATVLPDSLGGKGENIRGVKAVSDNGRTTLLINVDQINPASAVEEVAHAFIGREAAREIVNDLIKNRGGVSQALEPLVDLGRRYYAALQDSNPEAAAQFSKHLAVAEDINQPPAARQRAATLLAEEWAAMGVGEILSGADPKILETGRGTVSIWDSIRKGLVDTFAGLMTQPSAASKDPITGFFYKDGKLIRDKTLEKMADTLKESILRGKNLFPTDVPEILQGRRPTKGKSVEDFGVNVGDTLIDGTTVLDTQPRPRYEDTHAVDQKSGAKAGSATNKRRESRKEAGYETYHNLIFNQVAQIVGESVVDPGMVERGAYAGNLTKVLPGSPIISTKSFTDSELNQLFQVQTHHGRPLIAPEAREAVARVNDAAKHGNIISVDYDMRLGKGDKDREYAMRGNQIGLVTGMQQTPAGGLVAGFYNMSLLNEIANYQRSLRGMEVVDKALRDFGINSLDDFVPLVKAHIENYSLGNAVPAVDLYRSMYPGVSKESASVMRDLLHLSSGLQPRAAFPGDVVVNEPKIAGPMLPPERQVKAYDVFGKERPGARVYRDRNVLNEIRLDSIHNAQLYAGKGGLPVKVDINLGEFIPKQRSNFSPKRSISERMGESNVITDTDTGRRAFVLKNGVTKVFNPDGSLQGVYGSLLDAQTKLNKSDYNAEAVRLANSTARSAGAVGAKAITPQYVASTITAGDSVLNFGAGKPDKTTGKYLHSEIIRSSGGRVDEYDFGSNATGSLDKKYNTVFASNVLNVQSSPQMLETTLSQIWDRVNQSGRAVFNYPSSPRYLQMSPKEVAGTIEKVTGITPVRVGGTSSTPLWEVSKTAPQQANIRFSPRSPAAVRRAAEKAQELRGKMEAEAPSRLMATWLSELAAQKAQAAEPAQPQRAKGKLPVTQAELAAIGARTREIAAAEERFPGMAQLSSGQRAIFLRDLAEAENGITAQALARIATQRRQGNPSVLRAAAAGQLSKAEMARMAAAIERKAAQDYPVLDPDEVRTLFRERRRRPEAEPETADIRFSPSSPAAVRRAAEDAQARANIEEILVNAAQKAFKRPIEDAQARENIQETLANAARKASKRAAEDRQARKNIQEILANSAAQKAAKRAPEDAQARTNIEEILANAAQKAFKGPIEDAQARANIQEILANAAQKAFKRPIENAQARANLQEVLRAVAEKAAKQPKREPVVIDVPKTEIPKIEPPVEPIVTPAEEPRLPSNMIIARAPRGMFKLYSLTQQGKAVQEALSESYGDALQKAQRKYFLKNKSKEDQAFLKSQRYAP